MTKVNEKNTFSSSSLEGTKNIPVAIYFKLHHVLEIGSVPDIVEMAQFQFNNCFGY